MFEEVLDGTGCCINGSREVDQLMKSIPNYNVRDVLGLIVFKQHLTRRVLHLIKMFDELFVLSPRPIVVICDNAEELYSSKVLRVKNSPLYLVNALGGTVSDLDLRRVFTTLVCVSGDMYNIRSVEQAYNLGNGSSQLAIKPDRDDTINLVDSVLSELNGLGV